MTLLPLQLSVTTNAQVTGIITPAVTLMMMMMMMIGHADDGNVRIRIRQTLQCSHQTNTKI
jgi:hypothetical protein